MPLHRQRKSFPHRSLFRTMSPKSPRFFFLHHRRKILPYRSIFRVVSRKKSRFFCRRQRFDFFHPRQRFGFPLAVPRITSHLHARDSDRCASLASLLPPQAAFGSAARAGTGARVIFFSAKKGPFPGPFFAEKEGFEPSRRSPDLHP